MFLIKIKSIFYRDWFYDVEDTLKTSELNNIGSPVNARAESGLADFSALNVPVDDRFFCVANDSQDFSSNKLDEPLSSFQRSPTVQNEHQQPSGHQLSSQFNNVQSFDSGNLNNNANGVTFHQPFQNTSVGHVLQQNKNISQSQSMLTNAKFDYNSSVAIKSNFVDCQPSTSTAQIMTTPNVLSSQQSQNYQVNLIIL